YARNKTLMTKLPDKEEGGITCLVLDPGLDDDDFERVIAAATGYVEQHHLSEDGQLGIISGTSIRAYDDPDPDKLYQELAMLRRGGMPTLRIAVAAAVKAAGEDGMVIVIVGSPPRRVTDFIS